MPSEPADTIAAQRLRILEAISAACKRANREPSSVELVAVSKRQPEDRIAAGLDAGLRVFGENRVQEAQQRWNEQRRKIEGLRLHLIGPLQSNKARDAVKLFDVIETLDRDSLAAALADAIARERRTPKLLVQVNTGEEPQKSGVKPHELAGFLERLKGNYGLSPVGLMCIPPVDEPAGPHFALLAKLAARHGLPELSMGMSADFETAILFGATSVRVGSALFGDRDDNSRPG